MFPVCPHLVQTLQKHHHPDVSKAAVLINTPLVQQEEDISKVLEATTYQVGLLRTCDMFSGLHHILMFFTADGARTEAN